MAKGWGSMTDRRRRDQARRGNGRVAGDGSGTRRPDETEGLADAGPEHAVAVEPTADKGPSQPSRLSGRAWRGTVRRTFSEFQRDNLGDWAAALTYYGILSLFPGLLLLVSLLGMLGQHNTTALIDNLTKIAPGSVSKLLTSAVSNLQNAAPGTASFFAIVGLAAALWSASGYVGAFMRAANAIYDVPEGRPIWKKLPTRLAITVLTGVVLAFAALAVIFTGRLALQLGKLIGVGAGFVRVWDIAKWPVLVILVSLVFAVLYWASPNARAGGFRWITPGSLLAVIVWLVASGVFALYLTFFNSYNKTYGSIATVIIFLVWLWISNLAVLFGAEFDAEIQRSRAIEAGHPVDAEPYMQLRDTSALDTPPAVQPPGAASTGNGSAADTPRSADRPR